MCYRDMTFCNAKCANDKCHRKLTDKVRKDAIAWWAGDNAPIAVSNFSKDCPDYIEEKVIKDYNELST